MDIWTAPSLGIQMGNESEYRKVVKMEMTLELVKVQ
jgi:hypothetical protein